jgi:hypothetical protein
MSSTASLLKDGSSSFTAVIAKRLERVYVERKRLTAMVRRLQHSSSRTVSYSPPFGTPWDAVQSAAEEWSAQWWRSMAEGLEPLPG